MEITVERKPRPFYNLENVFNEARYPEVTFVEPQVYPHIKSSFRAAGKHVTISGPSGSGKTTLASRLIKDEGLLERDLLAINGRNYSQVESCFEVFGKELRV